MIEQVVDPDGTGLHDVTTKYAYDPNGNGWADLSSTGTLEARRIFGSQQDSLIARIDSNGVGSYLIDMLDSVRDNLSSTGALLNHQDFNAWGKQTYQTGASYADRFGFTGRPLDSNTELQNNRQRWYDAQSSRWNSLDPLGFVAGDSNLYRYAADCPTCATDASGDFTFSVGIGAELYLGVVRFGGNGSINFGWSPQDGWTIGGSLTGSIAPALGLGIGVYPTIRLTTADNVDMLRGRSNVAGGTLPLEPLGLGVIIDEPANRLFRGVGISLGPSIGGGGFIGSSNTLLSRWL